VNSDLTDYSVHDNKTNGFFRAAGELGLSVPVRSFLLLKLNAGVSYMRFDFSAFDGRSVYAREQSPFIPGVFFPIDDQPNEGVFSGGVINYTQDWLIAAPGFSLCFYLPGSFSAELLFQASPLIWCSAVDQHLQRNTEFRDFLRWGVFFEPRGKIGWNPFPLFEFSLEVGYRFIGETRGETYSRSMSSDQYIEGGEAGAGLSILDAGLLFKIRL
jgi:outer membrane protease